MVRFVKEVFRGHRKFQLNRPSEIRIGDSIIVISDGDVTGIPRRRFYTSILKMFMRLISERSKREQKHLRFPQLSGMAIEGRW